MREEEQCPRSSHMTLRPTRGSYSTIVHVRGEVVRVQLLHVVAGTKPCQLHQVVDEVTELAGVVGGRVVAYPVASGGVDCVDAVSLVTMF